MRAQVSLVIVNDPIAPNASFKVAAVARRTGVSVRTLHYYEEIGLLAPSGRTAAGHRLYTTADIQRLQQIRSLQQLGLSLAEVGDCLVEGRLNARKVVSDHLAKVEREQRALERLASQLRALGQELERGASDDANPETLLNALELITMYEQYFTPAQQERLADHQKSGEETVSPVLEQLDAARQRGLSPTAPEAKRLLRRFEEAVEAVAGGDEAMTKAIYKLLHDHKKAREDHGISEELFAYLGQISGEPEH